MADTSKDAGGAPAPDVALREQMHGARYGEVLLITGRLNHIEATVYNTLNQFTEVGLLRQVAVDGSKTYFDTNTSDHHHFFVEGQNALVDIPSASVTIGDLPQVLDGYEVARVDVVVRLKRKGA